MELGGKNGARLDRETMQVVKTYPSRRTFDREVEVLRLLAGAGPGPVAVPHLESAEGLTARTTWLGRALRIGDEERWRVMGRGLAWLHSIPCGTKPVSGRDLARAIRGQADKAAAAFPMLGRMARRVTALADELSGADLSNGAVYGLVHGDPNPDNVLVTEESGECLVDFEHATIGGDVRLDIHKAARHAGRFMDAFREGYGPTPACPDDATALFRLKTVADVLSYWRFLLERRQVPKNHHLDREYDSVLRLMEQWFGIPLPPAYLAIDRTDNDWPVSPGPRCGDDTVSVVIPVHDPDLGHAALTRRCLAAVAAHPNVCRGRVEVVAVDDGSPVPVPEGKGYRVIRLGRNMGRSAARNAGAAATAGTTLVFLDSDTVPGPGFIRDDIILTAPRNGRPVLLAGLSERHPAADFMTRPAPVRPPLLFNDFRYVLPTSGGFDFRLLADTDGFRSLGNGKEFMGWTLPFMLATFHAALRRDLFETVGGFDESFVGWGAEDSHLAAKCLVHGAYLVPAPSATVFQARHAGRDHDDGEGKAASLQENRMRMACLLDGMEV